jgi:hypothetical protein
MGLKGYAFAQVITKMAGLSYFYGQIIKKVSYKKPPFAVHSANSETK